MLPESITAQAVRSIDEPVAKEWISLLLETGLISVSKALEAQAPLSETQPVLKKLHCRHRQLQ